MGEVCAGCRFWQPPPGGPNPMGQCRRHPPVPFMVLAQAPGAGRIQQAGQQQAVAVMPQFVSAWAAVPPDGWCGEWVELPKKIDPPADVG